MHYQKKSKSVDIKSIPSLVKRENPEFEPIYGVVVRSGSEKLPKVALSFDADMTPFMKKQLEKKKIETYYNKKIIDILEKENVPATLFLSGLWAETYSQETKLLSENPLFEIGNHSYSHPAFSWPCFKLKPISDSEKEKEFSKSQEVLTKIIGYSPKLFRFPGGCFQKKDLLLAKKYSLTVVHWNVDGRDAFSNDTEKIITSAKKEVKNGSILIFHLNGNKNAPKTAEALPLVIAYLKEKGFTFVKISELLKDLNP